MTGRDLKHLRERLALTPHAFAEIVGVHLSSVYRWESTKGRVTMDHGVSRFLEPLASHITILPADGVERLAKLIGDALMTRGPMAALHVIMGAIQETPET